MKKSFRHSMTWLHTWAGLILCWVLYFMFVTGTLGYFDTEIDRWMNPERSLQSPPQTVDLKRDIEVALARLESKAAGASQWTISPQTNRQNPYLQISWRHADEGRRGRHREGLNQQTGEPLPDGRDTAGGQTLYRMHYLLHYLPRDGAFQFIALVTFVMFVSLITGVIAHKKIFKEFFTFRPRRGNSAWLDGHKMLSVTSLPFQLMITYSGLLFAMNSVMPGIGIASFGFDLERATAEVNKLRPSVVAKPIGEPAPMADIFNIVDRATDHWQSQNIRSIQVLNPGDRGARVVVRHHTSTPGGEPPRLVFDGVSGELIREHSSSLGTPLAVRNTFINLHEGLFAGPLLRWLYFVAGLTGAGMIATGAIYWDKKRQRNNTAPKPGHRLVTLLNIATIIGLPTGLACYFLANRLLPLAIDDRADWEVNILFIAWGATLLLATLRPVAKVWRELFWSAAILFAAIPVVSVLTTGASLWHYAGQHQWSLFYFELMAIALAGLFGWLGWRLRRRSASEATGNPATAEALS